MHITSDKGVNVAALTEGMRITSKLLDRWGQGCVELYQTISDWADILTEEENCLSYAMENAACGWPGVFAYEVTEEVGVQLRKRIKMGDLPDEREVRERVRLEIVRFCARAEPADREKVTTAYLRLSDTRRAAKLE